MTNSSFHPTRWTLVLHSRGQNEDAKAALSDLCAVCYEPLVSFFRREGRSEDSSRLKERLIEIMPIDACISIHARVSECLNPVNFTSHPIWKFHSYE